MVTTVQLNAQVFLGSISNTGSTLRFKISPRGGNITTAIGYFEFNIRYNPTIGIAFSNVASNVVNAVPASGFPGLSIAESGERSFGGFQYKRFIATVTIPSQTYLNGVEYTVFEVKLSSSTNLLDIQLATNYESNVPTDYYFVVSDGAGNPLVDVTGVNNFYPTQLQNGTDRFFSLTNIALPVELLNFQAEKTKNTVLLTWQTATERDMAYFDVERSDDAQIFKKIGMQKAKGSRSSYQLTDEHPLSNIGYYRLKMVENDGTFSYSKVVTIERNKGLTVKAFPNPIQNELSIDVFSEAKYLDFDVVDVLGRLIYQKKEQNTEGSKLLTINALDWVSGIYFLKVSDGKKVFQQKIVKR
jgi:hypothetical protein